MAIYEHLVIGIDGGGTKTHLVLCAGDGTVLAEEKTGQSNVHNAPSSRITADLRLAAEKLLFSVGIKKAQRVDVVVAGLAGIDHRKDQEYARSLVERAFKKLVGSKTRIHVVNDTVIGLFAGASDGVGICVVGGTGSNCYGRDPKGKEAWAGGLGHVLSDEGSGYDIGLRAFRAAVKAEDGRGPKTKLLPLILKRYKAQTMRDLVPVVYGTNFGKVDIAQLAFDVQEAAGAGDKVAKEISRGAGEELAHLVLAVAKQLFAASARFDVVMVGGVLQHDPVLQREFKKLVKASYPKAALVIPQDPPVMGAIRMALDILAKGK